MPVGIDGIRGELDEPGHRLRGAEAPHQHGRAAPGSVRRRPVEIDEVLTVGQELREAVRAEEFRASRGDLDRLAAVLRDRPERAPLVWCKEDRAVRAPGAAAPRRAPRPVGGPRLPRQESCARAPQREEADCACRLATRTAGARLRFQQEALRTPEREVVNPDMHRSGALPGAERHAPAVGGERGHSGSLAVELDRDSGRERQRGAHHPRQGSLRGGPPQHRRTRREQRQHGGGPGDELAAANPAIADPRDASRCRASRLGLVEFEARVADGAQPLARVLLEAAAQQPADRGPVWRRAGRSSRARSSAPTPASPTHRRPETRGGRSASRRGRRRRPRCRRAGRRPCPCACSGAM